MMVLFGYGLDELGDTIEQKLERGGLVLHEEFPDCPAPDDLERFSDTETLCAVEVMLPHSEAELACYLAPEKGRYREWIIPYYVLRGCPARVIRFGLTRHILGRSGEVPEQEWKDAVGECLGAQEDVEEASPA